MSAAVAAALCASGQQLPFGDLPPGTLARDSGCAPTVRDEASRKSCALEELRRLHASFNTRYRALHQALQADEVAALAATQRAWTQERNTSCGLAAGLTQREAWLDHVADGEARAACVLRVTRRRLEAIERMHGVLQGGPVIAGTGPYFPVVPYPPSLFQLAGDIASRERTAADFLLRSARSHGSGRHYFEVVFEENAARIDTEARVIARVSNGARWVGTGHDVLVRGRELRGASPKMAGGREVRLPKMVIGVAVDIDAARYYQHRDGQWHRDAAPGSAEGIALPRGGSFAAEVESTVDLGELHDKGIVKVNFGDTPFARTSPAGYRGFDWQEHFADVPAMPAPLSGERIAGETRARWLQRYWEWARSFPAAESPAADPDGRRCSAGQFGPVWFLTGSNRRDPVRRECVIPEGKIVLVPIVNVLAQANAHRVSCDEMVVSLRQFGGVADLHFSVDGAPLQNPERTLLGSGCFQLRDVVSSQSGLAAGRGYWVFLPPMKKGRYVLAFGGRFTADEFRQDIGYVLHVR